MRINVQVIEESTKEEARRSSFTCVDARRALLAKVVKPVRVRDFSWPVDYEPYEAEREIIAERLAEMGLK